MKGTAFYKVISQAVIPATHTQTHTEMHKGTLAERILHPYTVTLSQKENPKPQGKQLERNTNTNLGKLGIALYPVLPLPLSILIEILKIVDIMCLQNDNKERIYLNHIFANHQ